MKHGSKELKKKSKNIQNTLGMTEPFTISVLNSVKKKLKRRKHHEKSFSLSMHRVYFLSSTRQFTNRHDEGRLSGWSTTCLQRIKQMKKKATPLQVSVDYMKNATLSELIALERVLLCYKEIRQKERDEERKK